MFNLVQGLRTMRNPERVEPSNNDLLTIKPHVVSIIYTKFYKKVFWKVHRLKSSYGDVLSAVDDIFTIEIPGLPLRKKKLCQPSLRLRGKINIIWSNSMKLFWSTYELFSRPSNIWWFLRKRFCLPKIAYDIRIIVRNVVVKFPSCS